MHDNAFHGSLLGHLDALSDQWKSAFESEPVKRTLAELDRYLQSRVQAGAVVFPALPFRALHELQPQDVKVVLLGQDPYHGPGQAQGLAFSVPDAVRTPPSLRNMFAELAREFPQQYQPQRNSLVRWARQGVLLLNASLTVEAHQAGSHAKVGWQTVTDAILQRVLLEPRPKVFLLWGAHAQAREALLQTHPPAGPVQVLRANHPSPLSASRPPRPFVGCSHFSLTNQWLVQHGDTAIDWLGHDEQGEVRLGSEPAAGSAQGLLW